MRVLLIFLILLFWTSEVFAQTSPKFEINSSQIVIHEKDISSHRPKVFKGNLSKYEAISKTPIIGKFEVRKYFVIFSPLVPFNLNQDYTLLWKNEIHHFQIPLPAKYERLQVKNIYPSKPQVPVNILKWYIHFSKPVNASNIYDYISILNSKGEIIPRATLPLESALLSEDKKLLTIWIEPGRQKRDLGPNKILGSVFEKGNHYSLVVSGKLSDQNGVNMSSDWTHEFETTEADRISPDLKKWKMELPLKDTSIPFAIHFFEILDFGSTSAAFEILDKNGNLVEGSWEMQDGESKIIFSPQKKWTAGQYKIQMATNLEDLAGNNLLRLFDGEIKTSKNNFLSTARMSMNFEIK